MKNTVTEMKTAFHGFISRLDTVKEIINELENVPIETTQTEM